MDSSAARASCATPAAITLPQARYIHTKVPHSLRRPIPPNYMPLGIPDPHLTHASFLGLTRPTTPNSISIESAVFPQYTFVIN